MSILAALFFIGGLILEGIAFALLAKIIAAAVILHLSASLFIVFASELFLSTFFKQVDWRFYCFIFLLSFFIPLWGSLISAFVVITLYRLRAQYYRHAEILDDAINIKQLKPIQIKYGAGGALRTLMHNKDNTIERTQALFVLGQHRFVDINPIMYNLLSDETDEIRLLAFSILEQQESFITEDINKVLKLFETEAMEASSEIRAKLEKSLAMLYWELAYRYLIFRELEVSILKKAQIYALSAQHVLSDDATLGVLLGKIYTRLENYELAEEAFDKTIYFNIPPSQVLPYLAGIKFKVRDYVGVKQYLDSETLLDVPLIAPVKQFWDKT